MGLFDCSKKDAEISRLNSDISLLKKDLQSLQTDLLYYKQINMGITKGHHSSKVSPSNHDESHPIDYRGLVRPPMISSYTRKGRNVAGGKRKGKKGKGKTRRRKYRSLA
jgi:hypothetical protein